MIMNRRSYTTEFKRDAAAQIIYSSFAVEPVIGSKSCNGLLMVFGCITNA